ncbi:MAG: YbaK/EbsC family protein [Candidatus Nanopelagicales bacterium]|jgi:prolyl-tRNA editing enzyme YbaK/EbsC (Cys-tRNA(Pro) deacylase)|nr:YbaK/EbsC family protein [Candidatus Nanopelagicales bacterium]MDP4824310.1 YbaK/EbsC family protein [Candidatus Nanopelagicales bacterium]MDP4888982.1 YbaK/EbsC family protein [Candidatus Nanopelagicales bacterium]
MPGPLEQASVLRVKSALATANVSGEVLHLDATARTAQEAAAALEIEIGQIASSLIFLADDRAVLVVASGRHRVDTDRLSLLLGGARLGKANADDVRAATGFAIGGVAPIAHPAPLTTVVDQALADYAVVWAAAGHPHCVFPTTFAELLQLTGGTAAVIGD